MANPEWKLEGPVINELYYTYPSKWTQFTKKMDGLTNEINDFVDNSLKQVHSMREKLLNKVILKYDQFLV
jgi:hypothetical protein